MISFGLVIGPYPVLIFIAPRVSSNLYGSYSAPEPITMLNGRSSEVTAA
jgi:hypothetical protein